MCIVELLKGSRQVQTERFVLQNRKRLSSWPRKSLSIKSNSTASMFWVAFLFACQQISLSIWHLPAANDDICLRRKWWHFRVFPMQKLLSISIFPHDQIVNAACTVTVLITYKIISQAIDRHNAYESLPGGTWCCSCLPSVRRSCSISKDWTHRGELLIAIFIIVHHSFAGYTDVSNVTFDFVSLDRPCSTPSLRTR